MKKILLVFSILMIAAACNKTQLANQSQNPTTNLGVDTYISHKLGISFQYLNIDPLESDRQTKVLENGNTVYVYINGDQPETAGQSIKVLAKNSNQTLTQAVQAQLLKTFPKCEIQTITKDPLNNLGIPSGYEAVQIHPVSWDSLPANSGYSEQQKFISQCPPYIGDRASYFIADKNIPNKFAFISVAQYSIAGSSTQNGWQDTIKFQ